jgi:hypothetical protein
MPSKFDMRDAAANELLEKLPRVQHAPLVGASDLREIVKVFSALPKLEFPIDSAGALVEKLGRSGQMLNIVGVEVDPVRMIKYMPAYYFPIVSVENFIEKMAELIRANRKKTDVHKALADVKGQLPTLRFPISNRDELLKAFDSKKSLKFLGQSIDPKEMIARVHSSFFPLNSQEDFDKKVAQLIASRELIAKD